MRKATENWREGVFIDGRRISNLRYADDTTLLANDEQEMFEFLQLIENPRKQA